MSEALEEWREVMWLRNGSPIPDGWRLADREPRWDHHSWYARLIVHDAPKAERESK